MREDHYDLMDTKATLGQPLPKPALDIQVGGSHYKNYAIQPIEYILANKLEWCEANVVKYITRWKAKNGVEDLKKALHMINILIERETNNEKL